MLFLFFFFCFLVSFVLFFCGRALQVHVGQRPIAARGQRRPAAQRGGARRPEPGCGSHLQGERFQKGARFCREGGREDRNPGDGHSGLPGRQSSPLAPSSWRWDVRLVRLSSVPLRPRPTSFKPLCSRTTHGKKQRKTFCLAGLAKLEKISIEKMTSSEKKHFMIHLNERENVFIF